MRERLLGARATHNWQDNMDLRAPASMRVVHVCVHCALCTSESPHALSPPHTPGSARAGHPHALYTRRHGSSCIKV